jgi:hypothetical protein
LERRLWELLGEASPRDAAPLARVLMDLKAGAVSAGQARDALDELERKRATRQARGSSERGAG